MSETLSDAFVHYRKLLDDIEKMTAQLRARFPVQITCHFGCIGCCQQHLTLSTVEADYVRAAVRQLPGEIKTRVAAAARALLAGSAETTACPLLDGFGCAIY